MQVQLSEEALREAVLIETLARLLREKVGAPAAVVPPWRQAQAVPPAPTAPTGQASAGSGSAVGPASQAAAPDSQPSDVVVLDATQETEKREAPLEKFIRIFRLDELAAKCLLKLQDDEAAFVIESCQHRLKHAKNPSAVVMIAIKGVAAKVGRRYYGSRETAEGGEAETGGELKMIGGSPEEWVETEKAQTDPYLVVEEEEEEEEEKIVDQEVDLPASGVEEPPPKRPRTTLEEPLTVEVLPGTEDSNPDAEEDNADALFFVDTGGV
ncbi:unnamed protein product [Effrenium voratum]|nr:unnamed protein product [Effrenium voratum]|mmetsp:Transcript_102561/g.244484  ORF Transcript_102561/g.244484 Transcript_102561/m.244484 type:complete len:268 (-) Transcript_102561:36-839(-)